MVRSLCGQFTGGTRKKGSSIHSLSDLAGKILVVQTDSSALAALTGEDATEENKNCGRH